MSSKAVWVGMLHVKPRERNNRTNGSWSFVNVAALALDASDYSTIATRLLNALEFDVLEIEGVEPWSVTVKKSSPGQELRDMVAGLTDENWAAYSTFFSYDPESE